MSTSTTELPDTSVHPVVLFDGVCNFCDASINFLLDKDTEGEFRYASLQSESGQGILNSLGLPTDEFSSFVYVEDGQHYTRSSAALRVAKRLGGGMSLLYAFIIVPKFLRDAVYNLIANNRYKWFGKKDACMIPSPEVRSRFLP